MTTPISSFQGLASGIQWRDLVDQIVELEQARALGPVSVGLNSANARIDGWSALSAAVTKAKDALAALQSGTAFGGRSALVGVTATGHSLATVTNFATATAGRYRVEVQTLAQSEKLSGIAASDPSAALGISGRFSVNGAAVTLSATDSLTLVRDKINAANTGAAPTRVSASIVTSGGASRLILTADGTGARGIELADDRSGTGGTSTLESLGLVDGTRAMNTGADGRTRSMRVSSATVTAAAALGVSVYPSPASIRVNGRTILVDLENDSITDIAAKINAASAGAAAVETETDGGTTWSRLAISGSVASDGSAGSNLVLETLGLRVGGRSSNVSQVVSSAAALTGAGAAPATGATLLTDLGTGAAAGVQAGDVISLSGTDGTGAAVTMSYTVTGTDTLSDLNAAIAATFAPGRGVTAAVVDGRIQLTDSVSGDSRLAFTLSAGLQGGGTLDFGGTTTTYGRVRQLSAGADARILVDGALVTGATNTMAGVLGGATLNLQGQEPGSPFDVTVTATPETSVDNVKAFATAYNELLTAVTAETRAGGRLAFSSSARAVVGAFKGTLLNSLAGYADGTRYTRAGDVGLELQRDGTLKLDETKFRAALAADSNGVRALFASGGSATSGNVQFVGSGSVSPAGTFALAITRAATRSSTLGAPLASYAPGATPATMTVTDEIQGRSATITLLAGDTGALVAARLQAAFAEQRVAVTATVEGGALRLTGAEFGSGAGFTVSYTDPGAEDPATQLGIAAAAFDTGLDAAGTLDGEVMTGDGQMLTALNGIILRYTGTADTDASTVRFARGLGGTMSAAADSMIRAGSGTIPLQTTSAQNVIASLERRETDILARMERRRVALVAEFTRMETLLGRLQSQGQWLTSQVTSLRSINSASYN